METHTYKGIPASPGIVLGKVFLLEAAEFQIPLKPIADHEIDQNLVLLDDAIDLARQELNQLRERVRSGAGHGHAAIFDAHLQILDDPMLVEPVIQMVQEENANVAHAFGQNVKKLISVFENMDNELFRERKGDIYDVGRRIMAHLQGEKHHFLQELDEDVIVVAHDISPSDAANMQHHVIGFATDIGSRTSHTAIIARALAIPAVVGLSDLVQKLETGTFIILDGNHGTIIVNPDENLIREYQRKRDEYDTFEKGLFALREYPAKTTDGYQIELAANIELPTEVNSARHHGANGIGLYRTEFLFMNRSTLPSEDDQFEAYKYVLQEVSPHSATIRTIDLGGDKFISPIDYPTELNPDLGCRGIRLCLERDEIFRVQLRAMLRASIYGNLRIMFPMVSDIMEVRHAKKIIDEIRDDLENEEIAVNDNIEVGIMIEVPSAALLANQLAVEVDFFSIGTNDLIQYTLSVDRRNERIAHMYTPFHPAVLYLIERVINSAHRGGIWAGVCGEMAGDPLAVLLLIGFGVDELSVSPFVVPEVKRTIRLVSFESCRKLAHEVLNFATAEEVEAVVKERFASKVLSPIISSL